jgi:tetratricopeptide (TPR) repeat protein
MRPFITPSRILPTTLSLLCGALLLACAAPPAPIDPPAAAVAEPDPAPQDAAARADASYARGRALHLARRPDAAIAAYQAALKADPAHVNARNGLAIAYAERREFAPAIALWRDLTRGATMASGPGAAFLFANLGHAHLLEGDADAAVTALEKACLLDPLDARAWHSLGMALRKLGQDERARQMLRQAEALRAHDLRADYAALRGPRPAPIAQALDIEAPARPDGDWAVVDVANTGNGILELRRVAAQPRGTPAPAAASMPAVVAALEISNGNGRQGLARQLADRLRGSDLKVVRLSNEKGFAVRQTRVEYRPAYRGVAERLARRFGASRPVPVPVEAGRADVRLVLGHDLAPRYGVARAPLASSGLAGAP